MSYAVDWDEDDSYEDYDPEECCEHGVPWDDECEECGDDDDGEPVEVG